VDQAQRDPTEDGAPDGAAFRGMAGPSRRTPAAIALASLAILALALLTRQPDPAASLPTAGVSAQPQPGEAMASSPGPVVAQRSSPTPAPPGLNDAATPRPTPITTAAEPGTIQLGLVGPGSPRVHVVLGDGWMRASNGTFGKASGATQSPVTIGAWRLGRVHVFPCRWSAGVFAHAQLMQTASGQAQALASWWGQDPGMPPDSNAPIAPISTRPRPTTLAGYPAWSLEILIPSDFEMAACDGGQVLFWESATGETRFGQGPGELIRLLVVQVDDQPVVIEGSRPLTGSPDDITELDEVFDSIFIERGSG
jgi:hypothetical protein